MMLMISEKGSQFSKQKIEPMAQDVQFESVSKESGLKGFTRRLASAARQCAILTYMNSTGDSTLTLCWEVFWLGWQ